MFKQIIVVEGKTDTQKLKTIYNDIDTFETNGLNVNREVLNLLDKLNKTRGIIIFTDPDTPGNKIREMINTHLNNTCLNAFINKNDINNKKIGIAEASEQNIKKALDNLMSFNTKTSETLSWAEFLNNDFYLKPNRMKIANHFNWPTNINSKRLFKWLNYTKQTAKIINKILVEG